MTSTRVMVDKLRGCVGTGDLTDWEERFVRDMWSLFESGRGGQMSPRQLETIERLHGKHFA